MYRAVTIRERLCQSAKSRFQQIGGSALWFCLCLFITVKSDIQRQQRPLGHIADLTGAKTASPRITKPFVMLAHCALPFFIRCKHFTVHAIQCAPDSA
jgi:hypothetical protein